MGTKDEEGLKGIDGDEEGNDDWDGTIATVVIADGAANGVAAPDGIADVAAD